MADVDPLHLRSDGTFTLAQFTDLHWQNGEPEDLRTSALVEAVLDAERPDLAVFTGDVAAGGGCRDPRESIRRAVAPCVARGLPWAVVFGNHDDEGPADRRALLDAARALPGCLASPGPAGVPGVGNYRLPVAPAAGGRPAASLCFVDSGAYAPEAVGGYAWITRGQIEWYAATADAAVPALVFFHIPVPEYDEVWRTRPCFGQKHEDVCCPKLNSGFFTAMVEAGDAVATFVGHDHVNDYWGELHGIRLHYGRATGYHTYGRDGMPRGARVIRIRAGVRTPETWLRLDDGTTVADQPLHAPEAR